MQAVIDKITPTAKERKAFYATAQKIIDTLNEHLTHAKAVLGGSGAKDTWLAATHDIDIFVQYDYDLFKEKSAQLSDLLEVSLTSSFAGARMMRVHGSRDYFQVNFEGYKVEIVPILKIQSAAQAINITDVSPLHSTWVKEHASGLEDQIRLAKQFCRATRTYGAESYIGGFSGYVVEILVTYYGSFERLLQGAIKWRQKQVIDAAKHYLAKDALFHLNTSKTQSPLIVVDPVDPMRNAAAALTPEVYSSFKKKAKEFLADPSEKFFIKEPITKEMITKLAKAKPYVIIHATPLEGKKDVVGMKLRKVFEFLQAKLSSFGVEKADWQFEEGSDAIMYFICKKKELAPFIIRKGPAVKMEEYATDFRAKNQDVFEKDGILYAKVKNRFRSLENVVSHLLQTSYVTSRVTKITIEP